MITLAEAMLIVHGELEPTWNVEAHGALYIAPAGLQDQNWFAVMPGAREWMVDGNPDFMIADMPISFVHKENGEHVRKNTMLVFDRLDKMTSVALTDAEIAQYQQDLVQGS